MNKPPLWPVACCVGLFLGAEWFEPWSDYSPADKSFRVLLPGAPGEEKELPGQGNARVVTANLGGERGLTFLVIHQAHPTQVRTAREAQGFFRGFERSFGEQSRIESAKDIRLGAVPGKEIVADGFQGKKVRCRVYAVGDRSYQLLALSDDARSLDSESAAKFFNSFELFNLPAHPLEEGGGADGVAFRLGQIAGTLCVLGALAGAAVGAVVLLRTWRKARYRQADATGPGAVGEEKFPQVPLSVPPPRRYGWPLLLGGLGAALGLFHGLSGLARHWGEGPAFLVGYLVGAVTVAGVAGALFGVLVNIVSGPRR